VKATVKQVIEGKAAPKVLKKQSDAVATMGTKAKMASAGMAMYQYQGSAFQGFRSGQTKESSLTTASFFHSCNISAHNANTPVFREMVQAIKMALASYAPAPNNAASDGEIRLECSTECKTSHSLIGHFVPWYDLASKGLGKLRIPISDEQADLSQVCRCTWSYGRWWHQRCGVYCAAGPRGPRGQ
jgi:hypothetical protein